MTEPGDNPTTRTGAQPGLDCTVHGHIVIDWAAKSIYSFRDTRTHPEPHLYADVVACWCLWCGTGVCDNTKVNPDTETGA